MLLAQGIFGVREGSLEKVAGSDTFSRSDDSGRRVDRSQHSAESQALSRRLKAMNDERGGIWDARLSWRRVSVNCELIDR